MTPTPTPPDDTARPDFGPMRPDELDVMDELVPALAQGQPLRIIELGCGAARLARSLLQRHPACHVTGLEVDERQLARNLAAPPTPGLSFLAGGAQAIARPDVHFELAWMLKSLHHVPLPLMAQALDEVARVLVPGGLLYVSEPVYDGALNEVVRLYNDEGPVRAAAQAALDAALATGRWAPVAEARFQQPARFASAAEFEQRMMFPTFADHHIDDAKRAAVQAALAPHAGADGALAFTRPMHVRLLRRL